MVIFKGDGLLFEVLSDKKYSVPPAGRNGPVVFPQGNFFIGSNVTIISARRIGEVCRV
jgi:hypothetical protein